ncbi:MAG: tripartite tricarboxylate transporter substrate-binding protein [Deltaproteobacteria bacterium]
MKRQVWVFAGFFLLSALCFPFTLQAAAPYYEGKTMKIIVGHGAGGGYDRMARLMAKYLPRYIPGKPVVLVEYVPGASGLIAANQIYNLTKPDGLTIVTVDRGLPIAQLLKAEGVRFDAAKFSWIGSAAIEGTVLCIRSDLPYKTFGDLLKAKEPLHLGSVGPANTSHQFPILLKEFVGLKINLVIYPGSAESMLAIERKEADGRAGSYSSLKPFIERGLVRPVVRGKVTESGIENLPVDEDLTTDPKGKAIMAMRSAGDLMGRPFVAPPGTPPEAMAILREGFAKVAKDAELKEEAAKFMMTVEYVPADECLKVVNFVLGQPDDIAKEFSKYIKF